jgi:hypothetical protein
VVDWQLLLTSVVALGVLILLLRWAYGTERRSSSLVERPAKAGHVSDYGLLVSIAAPGNYIEGELTCRRLEDAGIRATLVTTADGPRVMVFRENETRARRLLASS